MKVLFQFSKYSSIAVLSTVSDWVIFIVLEIFGSSLIYAQMTARLGGGLVSFIANRYWSFNGDRVGQITQQGKRFLLLYLFSYVLSVTLIYCCVRLMEIPPYPSKIVADGTCFIINFSVMRSYVYKDSRGISVKLGNILSALFKPT